MEVTCRCGWTARGTKSDVIGKVQEHGRTAHNQEITPAEVRAIWRVVDGSSGPKK
jgi:predicted small metal-binding protein